MCADLIWRGGPCLVGLADGPIPLGISVEVVLSGRRKHLDLQAVQVPADGPWLLRCPEAELHLRAAPLAGGCALHWTLKVLTQTPLDLASVSLLRLRGWPLLARPAGLRVFQQGYQSWTPTAAVAGDKTQDYPLIESFSLMNHWVDSPFWKRRDGLISGLGMVLKAAMDAEGWLFGFFAARVGLGEVFFKNVGAQELHCTLDYGRKRMQPDENLVGEPLWIASGAPEVLLDRWAQEVAREMAVPALPAESPVGWCSWYEFYTRIDERTMLANLEVLARRRELGVDVVQLDDGYQTAVGDWLSFNDKFPRGLAPMVEAIHAEGFKAGLWLAPFFAGRRSRLFREHRDWFLHDRRGKPVFCGYNPFWNTRLYALDPSHPRVLDWLRATFAALVQMGFDYFKLDFLFAGLRHGQHSNPCLSPVEAYRGALAVVREEVGERFLLGCGAPLGPSLGLFDAMRISEDVKEAWANHFGDLLGKGAGYPSARGALRNNITRSFMHRRWWLNDPDCLLIRDRNTKLDQHETLTLTTILGMTGGMLFLSDDLDGLNPERLALAEAVLPPTPGIGRPMHLMESSFPDVYVLDGAGRRLLAMVNLENHTLWREAPSFDPGVSAFDFWDGRLLRADEQQQPLCLARHGVKALILTEPQDVPTLVGTDVHLTALVDGRLQARFEPATGLFHISLQRVARSQGRVWIRTPPGYRMEPGAVPPEVDETWAFPGGIGISVRAGLPWCFALPFRLES